MSGVPTPIGGAGERDVKLAIWLPAGRVAEGDSEPHSHIAMASAASCAPPFLISRIT